MIYDVVVVGGSFAGLSAAIHVARARRSVLVIDSGLPRNRFSDHSHGVLGLDGKSGVEILKIARQQVLAYPTAQALDGRVVSVSGTINEFIIEVEGSSKKIQAKRVVLATGVIDQLPAIEGVKERWGKTVLHCPYCHGYEIGGGSIGVIAVNAMSVHQAILVSDWGSVTLFTNDTFEPSVEDRAKLKSKQIHIEKGRVQSLQGADHSLENVELTDGRLVSVKAVFVAAPIAMASPIAEQLGCEFEETMMGKIVKTDFFKMTTVPGVYAAGDSARFPSNVTGASADGIMAGVGAHQSLVFS